MTIPPAIRHNQMTFIAIGISISICAVLIGCQLLDQPPEMILQTTQDAIHTAAPLIPPPYREILLAISGLLSSGIFIDNRRKDTVIKVLKSTHAHKDAPGGVVTPDDVPNPHR